MEAERYIPIRTLTFNYLPQGTDTPSCRDKHKATSQRKGTRSAVMITISQGSFTLQLSPRISHTFTRFTPTVQQANQAASNSTAQNTNII